MMLRAALLIFQNELRLLSKDRVGVFMLLLAPVVIIAVAGFSLGNLYGARPGSRAWLIPVVDRDGGPLANAVLQALKSEPSMTITQPPSFDAAKYVVTHDARAAIAIEIPPNASAMLKDGESVHLLVYADPAKRIEADAIELRLNKFCERITATANDQAHKVIVSRSAAMRVQMDHHARQMNLLKVDIENYRQRMVSAQSAAERKMKQWELNQIAALRASANAAARRSMSAVQDGLARQLEPHQRALLAANDYLHKLQIAQGQFEQWLLKLQVIAGSHAKDIPPPPRWPAPPSDLASLSDPIKLSLPALELPPIAVPALPAVAMPPPPSIEHLSLPGSPGQLTEVPALPGQLSWSEHSPDDGAARASAFDQYVPGFGITFLLIGMLMGISLRLIEDRDWGTLQRMRVSGAPLSGILIGKLCSRFLVGLLQLVILFAIGWWLFDISLGRNPLALFLPAIAISFAAAAFGLVIACLARSHDSVMPIGAVCAMAMSAIGGCWWPLSFEPSWMRTLGWFMPTTWTMRAFNDLMIRNLPPAEVLLPSAVTMGLGVLFASAGLIGASRLYR
jgi:ABC-type transport system involved in cytochrome c biogenesis permease component